MYTVIVNVVACRDDKGYSGAIQTVGLRCGSFSVLVMMLVTIGTHTLVHKASRHRVHT